MMWQQDALLHAKEEDPKESCGLLVNVRGKEQYYPCRNLSMTSYQCFILDPEDYIRASNSGDIVAVIHSHPTTPPSPSQADKMNCEASNLPWHIVNPKTEQWGYYKPNGYKPSLIGREYAWGTLDCWSLVRDWYKEERNIVLKDWERPLTPEEFLENPLFERFSREANFRELRPDEMLQNGDVLAMSIRGNGLNHVAIFIDGDVLHHLTGRLSCKEPYSPWLQKCTGKRFRYDA